MRYLSWDMKFSATSNDEVLKQGRPQVKAPHLFNVVLFEPDIPQNTGNIGRSCVAVHSHLHLIGKLGFEITDKNLKRAGLDYWQHLTWTHHENYQDWESQAVSPQRAFYFSAKAEKSIYDFEFKQGDHFVFGKETKGLPEDLMQRNSGRLALIPLVGPVRGLNVATSVAVVLYEAFRQLQQRGELDSAYLAVQWGKVLNSKSYDQFST